MLDPGQKVSTDRLSWAQSQTWCHVYAGPRTKGVHRQTVLGPTPDLVSSVYWTQEKRCPQTHCPGPNPRPGVTRIMDQGQKVSTDKLSWAQPQTWCHVYTGPWTKGVHSQTVLGPTPDLVSRVCWTQDRRGPRTDCPGPNPRPRVSRVYWTLDKRCPQPDCPGPNPRPGVTCMLDPGQKGSMDRLSWAQPQTECHQCLKLRLYVVLPSGAHILKLCARELSCGFL